MIRTLALVVAMWLGSTGTLSAQTMVAEVTSSRADILDAQRQEKASALVPEKVSTWERRLLALERRNFPQRLFSPEYQGMRTLIGGMAPGAGIVGGVGYMQGATSDRLRFTTSARVSTKNYRQLDAEAVLPTARSGRPFQVRVHGRYADYRALDLFEPGQDSSPDASGTYRLESRTLTAAVSGHGGRFISMAAESGVFNAAIRSFNGEPGRFANLAGAASQPAFVFGSGRVALTLRDDALRFAGVRAIVEATRWVDVDSDRFDFTRVAGEVQAHVPLGERNRMLAFRVRTSHATADSGSTVPFYLMETIGGSTTVRGFREYRFRDTRNLLANAEYRWEVWSYADLVIFADAGKVFSRASDLTWSGLATSYGVGVRTVLPGGGGFRIDLARGREGFRLHIGGGPSF